MINFKNSISILTTKDKKNGFIVIFLSILMAITEAIGVASIMPFLAVLGDPEMINTKQSLAFAYNQARIFGVYSSDDFLFFLGVISFLIILISAVIRTYTQFRTNLYIELLRHSISMRLLRSFLKRPYSFFAKSNSDELTKIILSEVGGLITYVYRPFVNLFSYGFVMLAILGLLLVYDPFLASLLGILLGGLYSAVFIVIKRRLSILGTTLVDSDKGRFKTCGEIFGGVKELKLLGKEDVYLNRYSNPSERFALSQAGYQTISQVPKYVIEAIAFGGVIALVFFLIIGKGGLNSSLLGEILPVLGLYTFSAYRIQPALQTVFTGFSAIRYGHDILNNIHKELSVTPEKDKNSLDVDQLIAYKHHIKFHEIYFSYSKGLDYVIENINLQISPGSVLGIVGTTGSGKTTFIDILLGLLRPTKGDIIVDGLMINNKNLSAWQRMLGYVPQEIFLSDASVAENIAFGVPKEKIDFNRVMECARVAKAHDFIVNDLDNKYDSQVGLRGVRISGGQRQRIGIARALYRDPEIIVFDEATSALDSVTEQAVMSEIFSLSPKKTVIIIAHRISTIKDCDQILVFNKGNIVASGVYEDLISSSNDFIELNKAYS